MRANVSPLETEKNISHLTLKNVLFFSFVVSKFGLRFENYYVQFSITYSQFTCHILGILSARNPCTFQAIATNSLYFAHPDPTKFIQCDLQGNAFVQQCPSGLVWNESLLTCASPLAAMAAVAQQQTGVLYPGPLLAGSTLHNATGYIW